MLPPLLLLLLLRRARRLLVPALAAPLSALLRAVARGGLLVCGQPLLGGVADVHEVPECIGIGGGAERRLVERVVGGRVRVRGRRAAGAVRVGEVEGEVEVRVGAATEAGPV